MIIEIIYSYIHTKNRFVNFLNWILLKIDKFTNQITIKQNTLKQNTLSIIAVPTKKFVFAGTVTLINFKIRELSLNQNLYNHLLLH